MNKLDSAAASVLPQGRTRLAVASGNSSRFVEIVSERGTRCQGMTTSITLIRQRHASLICGRGQIQFHQTKSSPLAEQASHLLSRLWACRIHRRWRNKKEREIYGYVLNDPLERLDLDEIHLLESLLSVWNRPIHLMCCRGNGTIAALSGLARLFSVCITSLPKKTPRALYGCIQISSGSSLLVSLRWVQTPIELEKRSRELWPTPPP